MFEETKLSLIKEFGHELCNLFQEFKTSIVILIAILLSPTFFIAFDNPPSFPLPESYGDPIDCFNIISSNISIESSRIKVNFKATDFIQFPNEVAPSLLHIKAKVGSVNFRYNNSVFWDLNSTLHNTSFCVLQTAGGMVEASLFCQNILLSQTKKMISTIPFYPVGWSRIEPATFFYEKYNSVCFDSNLNLVFCSKQQAEMGDVYSSWSQHFPISLQASSFKSYKNSMNLPESSIGIVVPFNHHKYYNIKVNQTQDYEIDPLDFLLDTVLPVLRSESYHLNRSVRYLLPNDQYLKQLEPVIGSSKSEILQPGCFKTLFYLPATGSISELRNKPATPNYHSAVASQFYTVTKLNKTIFQKLRTIYPTSNNHQHFDLVIDQGLKKFVDYLKSSCSEKVDRNCSIYTIDHQTEFTQVSNIVSTSSILLASNAKTLLMGSLLKKNSTVIYLHPDNLGCFNFRNFSSNLIAKYQEFKTNKTKCICKSANMTCYFSSKHTFHNVDKNLLAKFIWKT